MLELLQRSVDRPEEQAMSEAPVTIPTADPDVVLRQFQLEEADILSERANHAYDTDINMIRFGGHVRQMYRTPEITRRHIVDSEQAGVLDLGIWDRGELAGGVLLKPSEYHEGADLIEYWVLKEHRGRGLAGKAAAAAIDYALRERGVHEVRAAVANNNTGSLKVIKRLGFTAVPNKPKWYNYRPSESE